MKYKVLFLIGILSLLTWDVFAQGCSQCKLLSEQASELEEGSFGSNINYGILYLMAVPYILLFLFFRKRIFRFLKTKFGNSN
jgi:hypothetical protein